ncbi:MAG: hypothetical protein Q7S69_03540 [Nitrosomonadaceae bacterium]|nr:hypothetical protein [Nitrosomonadaceae bacterium]
MSLQFLKSTVACLLLTTAVTFSAQVQAHGGLALADDVCKLTIGTYTMHFTGYQPDSTQEKEFCEDIPSTGRTVVALDYIEEALRPMPTEIRVIRDAAGDGGASTEGKNLDAVTILHLPPKVYSNGSINFEYNFSQPGKFVGLVTINDGQKEMVSRFPFSVGEPKKTSPYLIFAIAAIIGAGAVFFLRGRRKSASA